MSWLKKLSVEDLIKISAALVAALSFFLLLDFRVSDVESTQQRHLDDYKQFRDSDIPNTYMRKDVMEQVLIRLDRIEQKIDKQNGH